MNILFSTLLMILTILLIFLPFIRRSNTTTLAALGNGQSVESMNQKDLILGTLGEIEFDYHMDKLSKEDYQTLKNNYAHIAVEVLKAENSNNHAKDDINLSKYNLQVIEAEIEKELESMNKDELTTPLATCFNCGTPLLKVNQEFCHACGERQN